MSGHYDIYCAKFDNAAKDTTYPNPKGSVAADVAKVNPYNPNVAVQQRELLNTQKGLRFDSGKLGFHLLPTLALAEVASVFDYGQRKYSTPEYDATDNWRKGLSWRSTVGSLLRHSFAFLRGEDRDPESGLYHMAHVAANALFLLQFLITNGGTDDRYKEEVRSKYKEDDIARKREQALQLHPKDRKGY